MGIGTNKVATHSRQLGKSWMTQIINQTSQQFQEEIDRAILREIMEIKLVQVRKTWRDGQGRKMHRVSVGYNVLTWLKENYCQQGVNNPEWWEFDNAINITDELLTVVLLRWGGDAT